MKYFTIIITLLLISEPAMARGNGGEGFLAIGLYVGFGIIMLAGYYCAAAFYARFFKNPNVSVSDHMTNMYGIVIFAPIAVEGLAMVTGFNHLAGLGIGLLIFVAIPGLIQWITVERHSSSIF